MPRRESYPVPCSSSRRTCNGGIKEVLVFTDVPDRLALWHHRCPAVAELKGELGPILARAVTDHWFDPCELLTGDARSEVSVRPRAWRRRAAGAATVGGLRVA
jgi:hypothetical protein